ncbi:hypothetical protein FPOAC2_14344 [Fusarium poae]
MVDAKLLLGVLKLNPQCLLHLVVKVGNDNVGGPGAVSVEERAYTVCKELGPFKPLVVDQPECGVEDSTQAGLSRNLEEWQLEAVRVARVVETDDLGETPPHLDIVNCRSLYNILRSFHSWSSAVCSLQGRHRLRIN